MLADAMMVISEIGENRMPATEPASIALTVGSAIGIIARSIGGVAGWIETSIGIAIGTMIDIAPQADPIPSVVIIVATKKISGNKVKLRTPVNWDARNCPVKRSVFNISLKVNARVTMMRAGIVNSMPSQNIAGSCLNESFLVAKKKMILTIREHVAPMNNAGGATKLVKKSATKTVITNVRIGNKKLKREALFSDKTFLLCFTRSGFPPNKFFVF